MSDAKITLETIASDEGLKRLNTALADGAQRAAQLQRELKNLERETQSGTTATAEQADAMKALRVELLEQKQANSEYAKAIKETVSSLGEVKQESGLLDSVMSQLSGQMGIGEQAFSSLTVAAGMFAASLATEVASALADFGRKIIELGLDAEHGVAQFDAMVNSTVGGVEAMQLFNTVSRDTYDFESVKEMGIDLMNVGYSANNAAAMIKLCADTAAGLGKGEQGARKLVEILSRMQSTGEMSSRQMIALQQSGMDIDKAFSSVGMTAEQAMEAMDNGTLDAQTAVEALTSYMKYTFDGQMQKSKENIIDEWGDVEGNLSAICGSIGAAIFEAFDKSGIVQTLVDFTQDLLDLVWSDGTSAFSELGAIAQFALDVINTGLQIVFGAVKVVIMGIYSFINAWRDAGARIANFLTPILSPLQKIWNLVSSIVSALGHRVGAVVDNAWSNTVGDVVRTPDFDDGSSNHFHTARREVKGGGGATSAGASSGERSSAPVNTAAREEERAIENLVKKYGDWTKARQENAKAALAEAKQRVQMLSGEAKIEADRQIKLDEYKIKFDELMDGYEKELGLASKIADEEERKMVSDRISERIRDAKELYDLQVKTVEYQKNLANQQANSKSFMDGFLADPDSVKDQVDQIKETLETALADIDSAMAQPDDGEQLSSLAQIIGKSPDALAEDLETKNETIQEFADAYKQNLIDIAEVETNSLKNAQIWQKQVDAYWTNVGTSLGDAFTDIMMGTKSAGEALGDFARNAIQNALKIAAEWTALALLYAAFGDPAPGKHASATLFGMKFADGGLVTGPGSDRSDSIPAMLSNGEYVINASAVRRIGVGNLDALNQGRVPSGMGSSGRTALSSNITLQVSAIDAASFSAFLQGGGMNVIKQALFDDNRDFNGESGVW